MPLTPEQFNKLVTKEDLDDKLKNLATKEDINKILVAVDGIAKKHEDFKIELVSNQAAHDRFEERMKGLEKKQGISQFA
jgi:ribosomal protein L19E